MEKQINEALKDLQSSLKTISSLIAWRNLKLAEQRPHEPPSFRMYDPTEADIKIETGFFIKTIFDIRSVLNELPVSLRETVNKRLLTLEARLDKLLSVQPIAL